MKNSSANAPTDRQPAPAGLNAAALRAVAGAPRADLRGHVAHVDGEPVAGASPMLQSTAVGRGAVDIVGVRLRFSDRDLHRRLEPTDPLERVVFDILEQFRCESLVRWPGVRANLDAAFSAWSTSGDAVAMSESGVGLLVFTVMHMAKARLFQVLPVEMVDDVIETTRGRIAPLIGHALGALAETKQDQRRFAEPAREIARLVAEIAGDATDHDTDRAAARYRLIVPAAWLADDAPTSETPALLARSGSPSASLEGLGGYHVATRRFDVEVHGGDLYPDSVLQRLRGRLDQHIRDQAVSVGRLARRYRDLFGAPAPDGWYVARDEGVLDPSRLARVVAAPARQDVFMEAKTRPVGDTVVGVLLDTSGSMKNQRVESLAALADTWSRALDLAGVANEVLGFTTAAWAGGRAAAEWRTAGSPPFPGRLAELCHIIYKSADRPWRRSRRSIAAMMQTHHYREGVDGEAIIWAHRRLMARPEQRRILVVVSDGAPMETATDQANGEGFLHDHLAAVVDRIDRGGAVEIAGVGVDLDLSPVFRRAEVLDVSGPLTRTHHGVLERLFG